MYSQKGSAILIVLMVLGIIGMMGIALMTQSRLDLQFSSSVRNYDNMFCTADGAASFGMRFLQQYRNELRSATSSMYLPKHRFQEGATACEYSITSDTTKCTSSSHIPLPTELKNATVTIFLERKEESGCSSGTCQRFYRVQAQATSTALGSVFLSGGQSPASSVVEVVLMDRF